MLCFAYTCLLASSCSHCLPESACTPVYISKNSIATIKTTTTTPFHRKHSPSTEQTRISSQTGLAMLTSEPSFSAFIPTSHSIEDLPPLGDDEELWEMFLNLVLEHRAKLTEVLADALNTSLLFVSPSPFHSSPIF